LGPRVFGRYRRPEGRPFQTLPLIKCSFAGSSRHFFPSADPDGAQCHGLFAASCFWKRTRARNGHAGECLLSNALLQSAGGDGVSTGTLGWFSSCEIAALAVKALPRSSPRRTLRKTSPRLRRPGMPWGCGDRKLLLIIELFAGVKDAVSGDFLAHVFFFGRCLCAELRSPGRRGWLSLRVSFLFPRLSIVW
jgi:hypothetical protein